MQAANILSAIVPGLQTQGAQAQGVGGAASADGAKGADGLGGLGGLFAGLDAGTDDDATSPFTDALAAALGAALQPLATPVAQPQPATGEAGAEPVLAGGKTSVPSTAFAVAAALEGEAAAPATEVTTSTEPASPIKGLAQPAPLLNATAPTIPAIAATTLPPAEGAIPAPITADVAAKPAPVATAAPVAAKDMPTPAAAQPAPLAAASPPPAPLPAVTPPAVATAAAASPAATPPATVEPEAVQAAAAPKAAAPGAGKANAKAANGAEPARQTAATSPGQSEPVKAGAVETLTDIAIAAVAAKDTDDAPLVSDLLDAKAPAADPSLAAAQAAATPNLNTDAPKVSAHTVAHLAAQVIEKADGAKSTRFDVVLNPEGLGKVDVRIEIGARGEVTAQMNFDNPEAASQMRARSNELQAALTQAGFDADTTSLSFNSGGAGQDNFLARQDQDGGNRPSWTGRAFSQLSDDADAAALAPSWTRRASAGGVDVRI